MDGLANRLATYFGIFKGKQSEMGVIMYERRKNCIIPLVSHRVARRDCQKLREMLQATDISIKMSLRSTTVQQINPLRKVGAERLFLLHLYRNGKDEELSRIIQINGCSPRTAV